MPKSADIIIIGGGIVGAATGYYLARAGYGVRLIEKGFLCAGSTGRCIGGIRQQFTSQGSIKLMQESVRHFSSMKEELGMDVHWHPGGYLFLAHSPEKKEAFLANIAVQQSFGLKDVRWVDAYQAGQVAPGLNIDGLLGGSYCPSDGQAYPFAVVNGYAEKIRSCGGLVNTFTEVTAIMQGGGRVKGVKTAQGTEYHADIVINAAGPWSREIGQMAGIDVPVEPERHEALITEGVEYLNIPMLVDYRADGGYFQQFRHNGQFIGCYSPVPNVPGHSTDSSYEFLSEMPKRMLKLIPALGPVKVIRQWSGSYENTPDGNPILDRSPLDGFYVIAGMCGHGFMLGPAIGRKAADFIKSGAKEPPIAEFALEREFSRQEAMK
ncbi:MAG: hypothetical protein A2509_12505 [Candidatus Edwardsbacteria bacterium RIFOXYD12_FULL_50_11]|uniref:FAD dependent oxidoreductase domain-containing protein n=1 Tax=Candidatus Edwardsbacteria bacterium GWF2_54_11 TaxID=1817851 RepID=A0A1F5RIU7_9BACT|nr:MAG: hypothetical protein A2502_04755 [Candidatus Edwardsbacteria bacterium RifOxyC12_full_54_24]OGF08702.1 MAG: hypothetical protein A2273_07135 [Candidatus Edwardsbacteria bacterium RifOxyA12_full_54_48]OGF14360.1 MAG: hypothetical protein A2024_10265 [Candidatus Edwardsbacteria bacterium GWF2_54_11]OGF15798.1 MAG: hypothetical protein A2509_12505 [Candidatus Edwardsbacteria bacterium RIFOXYD12_FULL_50_11]OGJ18159.1 MAG: hypothetical protein A2349_05590 [Candidatus Edwardsbacteria bacteriu